MITAKAVEQGEELRGRQGARRSRDDLRLPGHHRRLQLVADRAPGHHREPVRAREHHRRPGRSSVVKCTSVLEVRQLSARYGRVEALHAHQPVASRRASSWPCWAPTGRARARCCAPSWGSSPTPARCTFGARRCRAAPPDAVRRARRRAGPGGPRHLRADDGARRTSSSAPISLGDTRGVRAPAGARVRAVPASAGAARAGRGLAVRRRAADARGRPRDDGRAEASDAGRAVARTRAARRREILETLGLNSTGRARHPPGRAEGAAGASLAQRVYLLSVGRHGGRDRPANDQVP